MKKWVLTGMIIWASSLPQMAVAQGCSICTKTAASVDSKGAKGLNRGIVYLALLPLGIMGTIGFVWWRNGRS